MTSKRKFTEVLDTATIDQSMLHSYNYKYTTTECYSLLVLSIIVV